MNEPSLAVWGLSFVFGFALGKLLIVLVCRALEAKARRKIIAEIRADRSAAGVAGGKP
jgi:hypothetical protein